MDLDELKYSELQKLAKNAGIKANQKMEKLVKALRDYYSQQEPNKDVSTSIAPDEPSSRTSPVTDATAESDVSKGTKKRRNSTFEKAGSPPDTSATSKPNPQKRRNSTFEKDGSLPESENKAAAKKRRNSTFEQKDGNQSRDSAGQGARPNTKRKRNSTFEKDGNQANRSNVEALGTPCTQVVSDRPASKTMKRSSTFELDRPSLGAPATPEVESTAPQTHTPTAGTPGTDSSKVSPGTQTMLDSMSGNISSAERKRRLLEAIDKNVEGKLRTSPRVGGTTATQIPRFAAFLAQKKQQEKKPVTPGNKDWVKVHKKEFSKFDSVDVYLEKKRKRAEDLTASVKKARSVLHEVQEAVTRLKSKRTPSLGKKQTGDQQPFKPTVTSTKHINFNFAATAKASADRKSSQSAVKPFKPSVMSTKDMNLNFADMRTPVNGVGSVAFTSCGSSSRPKQTGNQSSRKSGAGKGVASARKSLGMSASRKSTNTPFRFTGALNTSQVNKSTAKSTFDLKASLARPVTWKPHTGKLKPLEFSLYGGTTGVTASASKDTSTRLNMYKTQRTHSRDKRRAATAAQRAQKKDRLQMGKRGIAGVH